MFSRPEAATDSTIIILLWIIPLLAEHTDVQRKCLNEINSAIGQSKPSLKLLKHRGKLPYLEATMMEVLHGNITPFALPHTTTMETTIRKLYD